MEKRLVKKEIFIPDRYEYLLIANPDAPVLNKVMTEKQAFCNRYKEKGAIKTKPHITVADFVAMESMEETIIKWIQRICSQQSSFTVMLNNYGGFPPHTIYLRVQNPKPFQQLVKQLEVINSYVKSNNCPPAKLIEKPHLTIARKLPEEIYSKAMMDYSQRDFHDTFIVDELVLLKRKHQFDNCEKVTIFRFLPAQQNLIAATA